MLSTKSDKTPALQYPVDIQAERQLLKKLATAACIIWGLAFLGAALSA